MFVLATSGYGSGSQSTPSDDTPPVPLDGLPWPGGGSAVYLHRQMVVARTAADRLQRFPDSPHTVAGLSQAHRLDDALRVLERVVQRQPERLPEALTGLDTSEIQRDQARGYRARARGVLEEARKKLPGLNRERAAAVAWSLLGLEQATADRYEEFGQRLDRYLKDYGDTEAGRLQQVEEMTQGRLTLKALADLDALAASVPGTEVAAKARYMKGFYLARSWNTFVQGGANPDPTDAFFELLGIVADLESGRYPACTWVEQAPELVLSYFMFQPRISPENAQRMLAGIREFIRTHTSLLASTRQNRTPNFLVTNLMPIVAAFLPDGAAVMERQFAEFEREWPDPAPAKLLRASWLDAQPGNYLRPAALPPPSATREADVRALLASAATSPNAVFARQALARLAEREFADPASLPAAQAHFEEYGRRFANAPDAWIAALRVAQVERAQGRTDASTASFVRAAATYADDVVVRALALANAGRVSEETGRFADAATHYAASLQAWTSDLGETLALDLPVARGSEGAAFGNPLFVNRAAVHRGVIARRVAEIGRSLPVPGGADLERARWLMSEGRSADAVRALTDVATRYASNSVGAEARTVLRRARLDAAVARSTRAQDAVASALEDLDALSREPFDSTTGTAGVVAATIRFLQGQQSAADSGLKATLTRWVADGGRLRASPTAGSLEADTLAVRDAVFLPRGNAVLGSQWNAAKWPATMPNFVVAPAELRVTTADRVTRDLDVSRQPTSLSNVVFILRDNIEYLTRTVSQLGGTSRREPTSVMQVPNQPIGGAHEIIQWWNRFFPARPGHWAGFEILTYPAFSSIEFTNAERTRALVPISVGYSGATVVLEKAGGVWVMKELVNFWIT
jgi:tetratricopeptide (TPR) repeat protein